MSLVLVEAENLPRQERKAKTEVSNLEIFGHLKNKIQLKGSLSCNVKDLLDG